MVCHRPSRSRNLQETEASVGRLSPIRIRTEQVGRESRIRIRVGGTLYHKGIDLNIPRMFELLEGIREALVIYPRKRGQRKHPAKASLSTLSDDQKTLLDALDLRRYATR